MRSVEAGGSACPGSPAPLDDQAVIENTRRWISSFVIGLGLCPFARQIFEAGRIRYAISQSRDPKSLLRDLTSELQRLLASPRTEIETTLLIHPNVLRHFLAYNDFLGEVNQLLEELGLFGTVQVASFHPQYRFAGTKANAAENYTNRSPYPMLHLLRETSVSEAADKYNDMLMIPRRNSETMRKLGQEGILRLLQGLDDRAQIAHPSPKRWKR
jgi:hypothetical protein